MSHTIGQAEQNTQESNFNSNQSSQDSLSAEANSSAPTSGLSDADYEFLFNQLLEGIAHGWHDRRIIKFFALLGDRGKQSDWVAWLNRLRGKLLKLPIESKRQLGTIMIRFGELTRTAPEVKHIGAAAYSLGRELLFGDNVSTVWEYVGPDADLATERIETQAELSQRLPNDFAALGDKQIEKLESVMPAELPPEDVEAEFESNQNQESCSKTEISFEAENKSASFSDTLISADELWADDSSLADESQPTQQSEQIDLDLGSSEEEDFEFELYARTDETDTESPASPKRQIPGMAADLQPEAPISALNDLSDLAQTFESSSDLKSTADTSVVNLESEDRELQKTASSQNSLALDAQNEETSSNMSELDDSSLELIESWFNLGLKQVSAGEYSKAIASWDKALSINANLPEAWHNRGSALGRLGDYEAAVKSFQNALTIDPENYQAWNDRAHALYQLQDWSGAVQSWSRALEIVPGNHLFWYNRGCSLEQLALWSEAIASYEKALEIKPDFQPGRSRYINLIADNSRPN